MYDSVSTRADGPSPSNNIELTLAHLDRLPGLPALISEVIERSADNSQSERVTADLFQDLPTLALQLVDAAVQYAQLRTPPTNLQTALAALGPAGARNIVLAAALLEYFRPDEITATLGQQPEILPIWRHSVAVAFCAKRLAEGRTLSDISPDDAFAVGLLHDIGKLALLRVFPKAYSRAVEQALAERGDLSDAERFVLGVDHAVAGRRLAQRWNLPRAWREVVWLHHSPVESLPASCAQPRLIALAELANMLVRAARIGHSANHAAYDTPADLAEYLRIPPTELDASVPERLDERVEAFLAALGFGGDAKPHTPSVDALRHELAESRQLAARLRRENRSLAQTRRVLDACAELTHTLSASTGVSDTLLACTQAARRALGRDDVVGFGLDQRLTTVELSLSESAGGALQATTERVSETLRDGVQGVATSADALPISVPPPLRSLILTQAPWMQATGELWLLPLVFADAIVGGLIYGGEGKQRDALPVEPANARALLGILGATLGRAGAHGRTRRLAEDLADSNRRLHQMQTDALRGRSLATIAEMAVGAGHELNNPLMVISGRAQILLSEVEDPAQRHALQLIFDKAHECSRIITELRDFARPTRPERAELDVDAFLTQVGEDWRKSRKLSTDRLRLELPAPPSDASPPHIFVDRAQLRTVLDEVLQNAVDAIDETRGAITISRQAELLLSDPAPRRTAPDMPAGPGPQCWVELRIRDTGPGMNPAVLQRVFDPFYSHRRAGRGRGLGLPLAYRVIEMHGGRIWIESQPDVGTTVFIRLVQLPATQ